jgi:uncharacterized membrane protein
MAIAALALAGAAIATYLVVEHYTGGSVACSFGGCETVQRSRYSEVLGVPVALIGLAAYLSLFGLTFSRSEAARAAGMAIAISGVGFGAYLLYAQIGLIGAICEWCVASDAVVSGIAALSLLRVRSRLGAAARGLAC